MAYQHLVRAEYVPSGAAGGWLDNHGACRVDGDNRTWPRCCQRLRGSSGHRVLSDPASTSAGRRHAHKNERRVMQRCDRYEYRPVLMCSANPDHLVPRTPSLTDIPPLEVAPQYRRDDGFAMNRLPRCSR
jgi:hypothetical protein